MTRILGLVLFGLLFASAAMAQPASYSVSQNGSVTAGGTSGTVAQAVQGIASGYPFAVSQSGAPWAVTLPAGQTVAVSNFPATQPVSGSVSVSNFPTSITSANQTGGFTDNSQAIGLTPVALVPAGVHHAVQMEINAVGGQVACSWTTATPAIYTAGSFTYTGQGQGFSYGIGGPGFVPNQALTCVAAAAATSVSVQYN